jgi:DNA-binding transcriptional MerR regulator
MTEKYLSAQQLARRARLPLSTVSFWAREEMLTYQRKNGRTRLFPEAETIARIRYIRERQSQPEGVRLDEIRKELSQGRHQPARRGS